MFSSITGVYVTVVWCTTCLLHSIFITVNLPGQGPVFAVLGAWLVCQILNQEALGKVATESMFQKAMIATALSCVLSNFGPIDDWLVCWLKYSETGFFETEMNEAQPQ